MDHIQQAPYWRFSLAVYGRPGVSAACLELQSQLRLDVNILLLALYATAVRRRPITPPEIAQAHALADPWHQEVVKSLRALRVRLKTWPPGEDAARVAAFRERVKALELDAEHLEQGLLASWVDTLPRSASAQEGAAGSGAAGSGAAGSGAASSGAAGSGAAGSGAAHGDAAAHLATAHNVLVFYSERLGEEARPAQARPDQAWPAPLEEALTRVARASADTASLWGDQALAAS